MIEIIDVDHTDAPSSIYYKTARELRTQVQGKLVTKVEINITGDRVKIYLNDESILEIEPSEWLIFKYKDISL